MTDDVLIYAHIGDLHLTGADEANARDLARIVDELVGLGDGLAFVFLPGDNADNGRAEQYALARRLLAPLAVPVHVITGDHDMEGGTLEAFHAGLSAERLPKAVDVGDVRCLFLDVCGSGGGGLDFRLGADQQAWLAAELHAVSDRRCAIFMHTYPADLRGPGETDAVNRALSGRNVLLVDMGHTHYNELANDGSTIFAATRSTGQIEEGPVGYALLSIDRRTVSWRFRPLGSTGPIVLITAPADRRLATALADPDHVVSGPTCDVRVTVLGASAITACTCVVDDGPSLPLTHVGRRRYAATVPVPTGARMLKVEAKADDGSVGSESIEFARPSHVTGARRADGSDADVVEAWPERGILGTQLGPNRNGRQW